MPYIFPERVERWRPLVAKYFRPEDVEKALYVIMGESSGDPNNIGDGGHSAGLFQLHDGGVGSGMGDLRFDPEANVRAAAAAVYGGSGWAPWGEGTEGTVDQFGALGFAPYGSDPTNWEPYRELQGMPGGSIDEGDYRMVQTSGGVEGAIAGLQRFASEALGGLPLQPNQPVGASDLAALAAQMRETINEIQSDPELTPDEKAFMLKDIYDDYVDVLAMLQSGGTGVDPNEAWRVQNEYAKTLNDIAAGRYGLETGRYTTENERRQAEYTNEVTRINTEIAQGNLTLQQAKDQLDRWVSARSTADQEAQDIETALREASAYGTSIDPKTGLPKTAFTGGDLGASVTQLARLAGIQNPESTVLVNYPGARMVDLGALQQQQQQKLGVAGPPPEVPQLGPSTGLRPVPQPPGLESSFGVPVPQFTPPPPPAMSPDAALAAGGLRNAPPGTYAAMAPPSVQGAVGGVQQFGGQVFSGAPPPPSTAPRAVTNPETGASANWQYNPQTGKYEYVVTR